MKPNKTLNPGNTVSSKPADKGTPSQPMTEEIGADSEILSQSSTQLAEETHENKTEAIHGNAQMSSCNCATLVVSLNNTMLSHMDLMKDHMSKQTALYQEQTALYHDLKASQEALRRDLHDSDGLLATSLAPIKYDLRDPNGHLAISLAPIKYDLRDPNGHLAIMLRESETRTTAALKEYEARASTERKEYEVRASNERKEFEERIVSVVKASEERARVEREKSEERIIKAIEASKEDSRMYTDTKVAENNVRLLKQGGTAIFAIVLTLVAGAVVYAEWIVHRVTGK